MKWLPRIRVYGCSDDLVEVEGAKFSNDEIGCYGKDVRIGFKDGTMIRVGYPKDSGAIWWIKVEKKGTANQNLMICDDEEAEIYSDVFEIESDVWYTKVIIKDGDNHV